MGRAIAKPARGGGAGTTVPHLGLVCITMDEHYRFRTTTLKRLMGMAVGERERVLTEIYWHNVQKLHAILGFCDRAGIRLYRISSAVFPMSDLPEGERALSLMRNEMASVGRRAGRLGGSGGGGVRMVIHPDQFVVLNSPSEKVRATSRLILEKHGRNLDWLGLPRSQWAAMNVHGGYAGIGVGAAKAEGKSQLGTGEETVRGTRSQRRSPDEVAAGRAARVAAREVKAAALAVERGVRKLELIEVLCREVEALPPEVRSRLTFENDEHGYSAGEIHEICERTGVAMVFDNLHHAVHEGIEDYDDPSFGEWVGKARGTWENPEWQMVHLSNGAMSATDRYHSGFITRIPKAYREVRWIEVEARGKERAIFHLRECWGMEEGERAGQVPVGGAGEEEGE